MWALGAVNLLGREPFDGQTLVPGQLKAEICVLLLQSLKQHCRNKFWTFNIASPNCMHINFFEQCILSHQHQHVLPKEHILHVLDQFLRCPQRIPLSVGPNQAEDEMLAQVHCHRNHEKHLKPGKTQKLAIRSFAKNCLLFTTLSQIFEPPTNFAWFNCPPCPP